MKLNKFYLLLALISSPVIVLFALAASCRLAVWGVLEELPELAEMFTEAWGKATWFDWF